MTGIKPDDKEMIDQKEVEIPNTINVMVAELAGQADEGHKTLALMLQSLADKRCHMC